MDKKDIIKINNIFFTKLKIKKSRITIIKYNGKCHS